MTTPAAAGSGPEPKETDEDLEERRAKSREAAKKSRAKKKAFTNSLEVENEILRVEVEELRERIRQTNVSVLVNNQKEMLVQACKYLEANLPDLVLASLGHIQALRNEANATVGRVIARLSDIIPPSAMLEIRIWMLTTVLRLRRSGVVPTDPLLRAIYDLDSQQNLTPAQSESILRLTEANLERMTRLANDLTRLRKMVDDMQRIGARLDTEGPWYVNDFSEGAISRVSPEQAGSFYRWFAAHLPMMQQHLFGRQFDAPGTAGPVIGEQRRPAAREASPARNSPAAQQPAAAAVPAVPLVPAPPYPVAYIPVAPPGGMPFAGPGMLQPAHFQFPAAPVQPPPPPAAPAFHVSPTPPAGTKRGAEDSPPTAAPRPQPAAATGGGPGVDQSAIRDLIREAVLHEVSSFFRMQEPGPCVPAPPGSAGGLAPGAVGLPPGAIGAAPAMPGGPQGLPPGWLAGAAGRAGPGGGDLVPATPDMFLGGLLELVP